MQRFDLLQQILVTHVFDLTQIPAERTKFSVKIPQCSKIVKSKANDFLFGPTELEQVVRRVNETLDFTTVLVLSAENPTVDSPCFVDTGDPRDFSHQPYPQLRQVIVDVNAAPTRILAERPLVSHHVYLCGTSHKLYDHRSTLTGARRETMTDVIGFQRHPHVGCQADHFRGRAFVCLQFAARCLILLPPGRGPALNPAGHTAPAWPWIRTESRRPHCSRLAVDPHWIPPAILLPPGRGSALNPASRTAPAWPWIRTESRRPYCSRQAVDPHWIPPAILLPPGRGSALNPAGRTAPAWPWIRTESRRPYCSHQAVDPHWIPPGRGSAQNPTGRTAPAWPWIRSESRRPWIRTESRRPYSSRRPSWNRWRLTSFCRVATSFQSFACDSVTSARIARVDAVTALVTTLVISGSTPSMTWATISPIIDRSFFDTFNFCPFFVRLPFVHATASSIALFTAFSIVACIFASLIVSSFLLQFTFSRALNRFEILATIFIRHIYSEWTLVREYSRILVEQNAYLICIWLISSVFQRTTNDGDLYFDIHCIRVNNTVPTSQ